MKYVGMQSQIWRNNLKSTFLLVAFPFMLLILIWLFFFITQVLETGIATKSSSFLDGNLLKSAFNTTMNNGLSNKFLIALTIAGVWFLIAWFSHSSMINRATSSVPLKRKESPRVYNLVENLCMSRGVTMPKVNIIEDNSLNAFASGLSSKSYTITLSRGIINKLNDDELEGVIAHELTHIMNKDVRLLVVSIIFVGIFSFLTFKAIRFFMYGKKSKKAIQTLIIIVILGAIGYFFSLLIRFSLSRKREYMADAGAAELTKKPLALASALRKISGDPWIESVKSNDIAQMFIDHPIKKKSFSIISLFNGLFATHPPIQKRIAVLEQY